MSSRQTQPPKGVLELFRLTVVNESGEFGITMNDLLRDPKHRPIWGEMILALGSVAQEITNLTVPELIDMADFRCEPILEGGPADARN